MHTMYNGPLQAPSGRREERKWHLEKNINHHQPSVAELYLLAPTGCQIKIREKLPRMQVQHAVFGLVWLPN